MKPWVDEIIKVGRIQTPIFKGDSIRHIIEKDSGEEILMFVGSDSRYKEFDMDQFLRFSLDWSKKDVERKPLQYFIPSIQKCSKQLFKKWKNYPNIEVKKDKSLNDNDITIYTYI